MPRDILLTSAATPLEEHSLRLLFTTAAAAVTVFKMLSEREYKGSEGATDMLLRSTFTTINWQPTSEEQVQKREKEKGSREERKNVGEKESKKETMDKNAEKIVRK